MKIRAALSTFAVAVALTACSSSGTNGHLTSGSSGGPASSGGGSAAVSNGGGAAVSSASSNSGGGVSGGSGPAAFCASLKTAETQLGDISGAASDPSKASSVFDAQIKAFKALEVGAPASVAPAIKDLVQLLTGAQSSLSDPSHADPAALQALSTRLPQDAQIIGTYVGSKCAGG